MDDLRFYILLNCISFKSGCLVGDNERLCAMVKEIGIIAIFTRQTSLTFSRMMFRGNNEEARLH